MYSNMFNASKEAETIGYISSSLTSYKYNEEADVPSLAMRLLMKAAKDFTEVNKMAIQKLRGIQPNKETVEEMKTKTLANKETLQAHLENGDITQAEAESIDTHYNRTLNKLEKL
jgi:hypothetical protein